MLDFHKMIDGFESGDLYAVCCEIESTIDWLYEDGKLASMTFDDVIEHLLSKEQYEEYINETESTESYDEYRKIRLYVANDKAGYFNDKVNELKEK